MAWGEHSRRLPITVRRRMGWGLGVVFALAAASCGGSGDGGPDPAPAPAPPPAAQSQLTHMAGALSRQDEGVCQDAPDGTGAEVRFRQVLAMTEGPDGSVLLAEWPGQNVDHCPTALATRVRQVDAQGRVTTLAQGEAVVPGVPKKTFNVPTGVAVGADGSVFIGDGHPSNVALSVGADGQAVGVWRRWPDGRMSAFAGIAEGYRGGYDLANPVYRPVDGLGTAAQFITVQGLAMTGGGVLYALDFWFTLRRIGSDGMVTTVPETPFMNMAGAPGGDAYVVVCVEPAPPDPACEAGIPMAPPNPDCPPQVYRGNEPGPLPAHLGRVEAMTGGADGSLYILADGALLKASFGD
ncbi:MAG: hypothetical protein Q4G71_10555 [Pseudomonadota bacterium]|nr:hypothetical protein [Pseudomonadota bacterium]